MKKIIKKTKTYIVAHKEGLIRLGFYAVGVAAGMAAERWAQHRGTEHAWDSLELEAPEDHVLVQDREGSTYYMRVIPVSEDY